MKASKAMRKLATKIVGYKVKVKKGQEWETDWETTIWWVNDADTKVAGEFRDFFTANCPDAAQFSNITLSLLHEIGHIMTLDEADCEEPKTKNNMEYFRLHDEWLATEWAIDYLMTHKKKLRKFEKSLDKRLRV